MIILPREARGKQRENSHKKGRAVSQGEVGLIFAEDLPPKSTPYTEDEVWAAVGSGAMVIEVCRSSFDAVKKRHFAPFFT